MLIENCYHIRMTRVTDFLKKHWKMILTVLVILAVSAGLFRVIYGKPVITYSWDEEEREEKLSREITTAINIYTDGTAQEIFHETGTLEGVQYDILRVIPSGHTFLQIDYTEEPKALSEIVDKDTILSGFHYAGGINAGFFQLSGKEYGRPVGAVRRKNDWTTWHGEENTPAYGSGFATAYFTGDTMWLKYHGWQDGEWKGDKDWTYESGYTFEAENGISGSYTYIVDGIVRDITGNDKGLINYRTFGRAATIFAQNEDKEYLLIEIYGEVDDKEIIRFLKSLHVTNAIRMDGGISTQMVYIRQYVTGTK